MDLFGCDPICQGPGTYLTQNNKSKLKGATLTINKYRKKA